MGSTTTEPTSECGNGDVEDGEECDGADWNGATCESLGHFAGALACGAGCEFDVSGCVPPGMVLVPGGEFTMGSDMGSSDEEPVRVVQVDSFYIDQTEVTVSSFGLCVSAGVCDEPSTGGSCNWMVAGRGNHPINCVDWSEATQYCGWVGGGTKRLPTEAEWEKAARGPDARVYPWGDAPAPSCLHVVMDAGTGGGCGMNSTMEVGSKPLGNSPYGAQDMSGNVWEWVSDWYAGSYEAGDTDNPTGPASGYSRVLRGGSWYFNRSNFFRAAGRLGVNPTSSYGYVGFRCARTPPAAT